VSLSWVDILDEEVNAVDMVALINSERVVHLGTTKGSVLWSFGRGDDVIMRRQVQDNSTVMNGCIVIGRLSKLVLDSMRCNRPALVAMTILLLQKTEISVSRLFIGVQLFRDPPKLAITSDLCSIGSGGSH
jgi:hypothetical protein